MNTGWGRRLQVTAACALVIAYAALSHYCNATRSLKLGTALALAPLTALILVLLWRLTAKPIATLLTGALAAVLYLIFPLLEPNFSVFYVVQESIAYSLLGVTFGRTLRRGRIALCTRLADKVQGPLSQREVWYTRRVTAAWTVFFFAIAAVSLLLYSLASLRVWSIYINFCVLPLVGAMFVVEYLVRRRVLPKVKRAGLLATVRVYFANP